MAKLSPEKKAARAEKFKATMAAKRAAQVNFEQAKTEHQQLLDNQMVQASVAEVLAANPIRMVQGLRKGDTRVELALAIVNLLQRVLR